MGGRAPTLDPPLKKLEYLIPYPLVFKLKDKESEKWQPSFCCHARPPTPPDALRAGHAFLRRS